MGTLNRKTVTPHNFVDMQSIIEHRAKVTAPGILRMPAETVGNLEPGMVFFHPGKFDGKTSGQDFPNCPQGFYMICDSRFDGRALCISWDPADWVGESASYDPETDRAECLREENGVRHFDISGYCARYGGLLVAKSDRVVPIAEDIDSEDGPENARLLVNELVKVSPPPSGVSCG